MSLVLKSNVAYKGDELAKGYRAYVTRVLADGGQIFSTQSLFNALVFASSQGIDASIGYSITSASWGFKESEGRIVKLYSLFGAKGDIQITGDVATKTKNGKQSLVSPADSRIVINTQVPVVSNNIGIVTAYAPHNEASTTRALSGFSPIAPQGEVASKLLMRIFQSNELVGGYYNASVRSALGTANIVRDKVVGIGIIKNDLTLIALHFGEIIASTSIGVEVNPTDVVFYPTSAGSGQRNSMLGDLYESWALEDATLDQAKAIGKRIQDTYV